MTAGSLKAKIASENPKRIAALDADFDPIFPRQDHQQFFEERWPGIRVALPVVSIMATHSRAELLAAARNMAASEAEEGKSMLLSALDAAEAVQEFCESMAEVCRVVHSRLLVMADDLLMEAGEPSQLAKLPR